MIVSAILGGIGNQMFQYAAGRALAVSRSESFMVDLAGFENYSLHQGYELQRVFDLEAVRVGPNILRDILGWRAGHFARKVLKRSAFSSLRGAHLAIEPHLNYWPGLDAMESPVYMMGYWQSARYFGHCEDVIRDDFRFRHPQEGRNTELAARMAACQSVSLHIRRGDYVTHKATREIMHACSLDYYREAVRRIDSQIPDAVYFVFSDDMDWVRQQADFLPRSVLIDHNCGQDSYRDMQLMSACRHHIIANSSFSWWGAWLNPRPDKVVIAPRRWFANDWDSKDLIPEGWVTL